MLHHLVLFELRDGVTEAQADAAVEALRALADVVDGIESLVVGRDAGLAEGNADLALLLVARDEEAWRAYQQAPEHVRVVTELVRPIVASRTAAQLQD